MKTILNGSNILNLETLYLQVNNLNESLEFFCDDLGFDVKRTNIDSRYRVFIYLSSNSYKEINSFQLCITEASLSENNSSMLFAFGNDQSSNGDVIAEWNQGIPSISETFGFPFLNTTLPNDLDHYCNAKHKTDMIKGIIHETNPCDTQADSYKFSYSKFKKIKVTVSDIQPVIRLFKNLGCAVDNISISAENRLQVEILVNESAGVSILFEEDKSDVFGSNIKNRVAFVIESSNHTEPNILFESFEDIGYKFLNNVLDVDRNVIADHAEFNDLNGYKWIIESDPLENDMAA